MKKLILVLVLTLLPGLSFAGSHSVGVTMAKVQGGVTPFASDSFDRGDNTNVLTGSSWDFEGDGSGRLSISSYTLLYTGSSATAAAIRETTHTNKSETTAKFTIKFGSVLDVHTTTQTFIPIKILNDSDALVSFIELSSDAGGDVYRYRTAAVNNVGSFTYSGYITLTGIAADTEYNVYLYLKADSSAGGAACKIGAWGEAATAFNLANDAKGNGRIDFGATETYWGFPTPSNITLDNFAAYDGDER